MRKIIAGLFLLFVLSCSKENGSTPVPKISMTEAIDGKSWKVSSIILTSSDGAYLDIFNINFQPCEKDDILTFKSDGVFIKTDGAVVCNPPGNSVFNSLNGADWSLETADSTLSVTQFFSKQVFKIKEWSSTNMTWTQSSTNYVGFTETVTYKLVLP